MTTFTPIRHIDPVFDDLLARRGKFSLTMETLAENWRLYMALFGKMIIWRAEATWIDNRVHYDAVSPLFDRSVEGSVAPVYEFEFETVNVEEHPAIEGMEVHTITAWAVGSSLEPITLMILSERDPRHDEPSESKSG